MINVLCRPFFFAELCGLPFVAFSGLARVALSFVFNGRAVIDRCLENLAIW
jgi:hypothetical protein